MLFLLFMVTISVQILFPSYTGFGEYFGSHPKLVSKNEETGVRV